MPQPRIYFPRSVAMPKDLEEQWAKYKAAHPSQSFNGLVIALLREALCATNASISTTR